MSTGVTRETEVYLVVKPTFGRRWNTAGSKMENGVQKIQVTAMRQSRPVKPDGVVVKLKLRFPEGAFMPLEPSAVIDIPLSLVDLGQDVEVEAVPNDQAALAFLAGAARQQMKP